MPAFFALCLSAAALAAEPDLILAHGKVFLAPGRYAQAVAVAGNRIAAVGTDGEVLARKTAATRVVDLKGRTVLPGFHDAHTHFLNAALLIGRADLGPAKSLKDIQNIVARYSADHPDDPWIIGRGWDPSVLPAAVLPDAAAIDAAISTRPVALGDYTQTRWWLNSEGLRRIGITSGNARLPPGQFTTGANGRLNGVFMDQAADYVGTLIPKPSRPAKLAGLRKALAIARRCGVTSIDIMQEPGDDPPQEQLTLWRELEKSGEMTSRWFLYGRIEDQSGFAKVRRSAQDVARERLDFIGLEAVLDGEMGHAAALLAPYFDRPATSGTLKHSTSSLNALVRRAHRDGFQVALRALGDRAVRQALDVCERSERQAKDDELVLPPYPCRVEGIDVVAPEDLPRFRALRAAASMQPSMMAFDSSEANYFPNRLGTRVKWSFPWKSLEDAGALLIFGSDWPSTPFNPEIALAAAATRTYLDGKPEGGWIPEQKISLESAVEHYTEGAALAIGHQDSIGSISPGKLADLVVLDRDLFATPPASLREVSVDLTIFDGKVVYQHDPAASTPQ